MVAIRLLCIVAVLLCSWSMAEAATPVGTSCTKPRVRKSWESFTATEKTTYKNAVQLAMDKGLHVKFIEMHKEYFSELEAHRQCMFMYWHRRFLLGYENMLRSLGKTYECVTLPVWDHLYATAKRQMNRCDSILSCSQIYQDFGGTSSVADGGKNVALVIYNQTIDLPSGGTCVTKDMPSHFCGAANLPPTQQCQHCITRGAPSNDYPGDAYLSSVMGQLFPSTWKWVDFANGVERGVHNAVHGYIDGVMAYFESPADPLFYSHHAFVDALQTIYLKCAFQIKDSNQKLTAKQKTSDAVWSGACERRPQPSGKYFKTSDTITMKVRDAKNNWVDVNTNTNGNTLYDYFKDLPKKFSDYVDAKDLGPYSYTYSFNTGSNLYKVWDKCEKATTTLALSASLLADDKKVDDFQRVDDACADTVHKWTVAIYSSAILNGYTEQAAHELLEIITCVHKNECVSSTQDYGLTFRKNFGVQGHSRCYKYLDMLEKGDKVIGVPHWREITDKFLPCPVQGTLAGHSIADVAPAAKE